MSGQGGGREFFVRAGRGQSEERRVEPICVGGKLPRLCFHSDAQSARVSHRVMYLMISQDLHVPNGPNPCERDPVHLGELEVATMLAKSSGAAPTFGASRSMHASRLF